MHPRRLPVSVICVFNDPDVRRGCLDRSIADHRGEAEVEYLPIDNVDGAFATAGEALNHGASLARHEHLVFVHQDVYLHSLAALEVAAGALADDPGIGLLGAIGVDASGELVGRIRDRVSLLGEPPDRPSEVVSLDEVLFMAPRDLVLREPLSEAAELAWHAYAIEYGLRVTSLGLRVCATDIPLTHNSATANLERLDVAYQAVAAEYPEDMPLRASCGTVDAPSRLRRGTKILQPHRWRYRWLRESVVVHAARRIAGGGRCVLGDIRLDIDDVLASDHGAPLRVLNLERGTGFSDGRPLDLVRDGRPISLASYPMPKLIDIVSGLAPGTSMLVTDLHIADLKALAPHLPRGPRVLGFRREIGLWILLGAAAEARPREWRSPKARPLGMPAPAA